MRPGEVQRWRMLNAASGETLPVALQKHNLHIIANDGITIPQMITLDTDEAYVMGAGNRVDVLIKAGEPGTYLLQVLDTKTPRSVSTSDVAPDNRRARIGRFSEHCIPGDACNRCYIRRSSRYGTAHGASSRPDLESERSRNAEHRT